jgi:hypothetical protein
MKARNFGVICRGNTGATGILVDYYHGSQTGLPQVAGQLGAAYAIVMIYVPLLMITHVTAFYLFLRPQQQASAALTDGAPAN